jgi:hypothetical protein
MEHWSCTASDLSDYGSLYEDKPLPEVILNHQKRSYASKSFQNESQVPFSL